MSVYACRYIHICISQHIYITQERHTGAYVYLSFVCVYIYIYIERERERVTHMHACMYVLLCVCRQADMHESVHMCVYEIHKQYYTHTYVCMHTVM